GTPAECSCTIQSWKDVLSERPVGNRGSARAGSPAGTAATGWGLTRDVEFAMASDNDRAGGRRQKAYNRPVARRRFSPREMRSRDRVRAASGFSRCISQIVGVSQHDLARLLPLVT